MDIAQRGPHSDARLVLKKALKFTTTTKVKRFMLTQLQRIAPNLAMLDTA